MFGTIDWSRPWYASVRPAADGAWEALSVLPRRELTMLPVALIEARYRREPESG